jgi:hypothetical protein
LVIICCFLCIFNEIICGNHITLQLGPIFIPENVTLIPYFVLLKPEFKMD